MPKKSIFERDLTNIAISRRAHNVLLQHKGNQPIYYLVDRLVASHFDKNNETENLRSLYDEAVETAKAWKNKYEELNGKLRNTLDIYGSDHSG